MIKFNRHNWKKILIAAFIIIVLFISVLISIILHIVIFSKDKIKPISKTNSTKVAIVFGAKIHQDGILSEALQNRVNTAIKLYKIGKVQKLLFTGDNSRQNYDEVTNMKNYAVEEGVSPDDIKLDYAGFRTYDSCYRAKEIFGVTEVVLVSQRFHLYRAIYECNKLGVDSIGVAAVNFSGPKLLQAKIREVFAIIQAYWEINLTHPKPKFLGNFEGI